MQKYLYLFLLYYKQYTKKKNDNNIENYSTINIDKFYHPRQHEQKSKDQ